MAVRDFPVSESPHLRDRALEWMSSPGDGVEARLAATVMFVRDAGDSGGATSPAGAGHVEVFMIERVPTMAFAPSMHVFPGGGVDRRDAEVELPWAGPTVSEWAARLGVEEDAARMLVCAAAREVFEESGVLLAGPEDGPVLDDLSGDVWRQRRKALVARELSFAEMLAGDGLVLRTDLLSYRAHWITPEFEERRYDTYFFAATVPDGQVADDDTTEAERADWERPTELLEGWRSGDVLMLPPTLTCLEEIAAATDAAAFVTERPDVPAIMPSLVDTPDGIVLRMETP